MLQQSTEDFGHFREIVLDSTQSPTRELSRAARMPRFLALPSSVDPSAVLSRLRVACLGVGAVGRNACVNLGRLGVKALWICDRALYKAESLLTQPIDVDEVGLPKAEAVGRLVKRLSPSTSVHAFVGSFESLGPTAFADVDVVVLAADNIRTEIECGQACLRLGKPLIQASVHGGTLTAQVRFYGNAAADGPCPACGLTSQERAALNRETIYSCDGSVAQNVTQPTVSTPHLCAIAGDLAVNQVLRHALGLGSAVVDQEIEWNGYTMQSRVSPLSCKPHCPADHVVWQTRHAERPVADHTLRELAQTAGMHDDGRLERTAFRVGQSWYVQRGVCPRGHNQTVERFIEAGKPVGACATCREPVVPEPYFMHETAPGRLLPTQLDRPLRELCAEPPQWVVVSENGDGVLVRAAREH
jgi:molybdopterin/thiamine biosynthesis adenylyltransferase